MTKTKSTAVVAAALATGLALSGCAGASGPETVILDTGAIYEVTATGEQCNFGEVFTTDGRIPALNLTVLEDDLEYHPVYQVAFTLQEETLNANPGIADVLNPVAAALTEEAMQNMNAAVDIDGEDPADVAQAFLEDNGLLGNNDGAVEGLSGSVGSKEFTEQLILGNIGTIALADAGADVEYQQLAGTAAARAALEAGEIIGSYEYTGTGWIVHLGNGSPVQGTEAQYQATAEADLEENGIVWLDGGQFNNTYAFAISEENQERLGGLTTLSEIADLDQSEWTFCIEQEYSARPDGWPGLASTYGWTE